MNKDAAMAVLQSRLDQREMARQAQMNAYHTQSLTDIGGGNQIRSYVVDVCSQHHCNFHYFPKIPSILHAKPPMFTTFSS